MGKIAIIGGTALSEMEFFKDSETKQINTDYGTGFLQIKGECIFVARHGEKIHIPPHRINYHANIASLHKMGVVYAIGVNSVGSLKENIPPGYLLVPDDYINFWDIITFYNKEPIHIIPELNEDLRRVIIASLKKRGENDYKETGIYIQTRGPRLETKAEINMLKLFGDVVGMTMASEATLCKEIEIPYASICSIDNYCHGISAIILTYEEIKKNARKNQERIESLLKEVITTLI